MIRFRSIIFTGYYFLWTGFITLCLPIFVCFPRPFLQAVLNLWGIGARWGLRWIVGLKARIEGRENLPADPAYVVASKHQSAWDTMAFHGLTPDPVYVLKQELGNIPFWKLGFQKAGSIVVDRAAGANALKKLTEEAKRALSLGRQPIIFPEGTRAAPDEDVPYHPGVAAIYKTAGAPVVPVALNSGIYWGRFGVIKFPGEVVLKVLPPIAPGMDRKEFMRELKSRIDGESAKLLADAREAYAFLPSRPQSPPE